ncbi:MAG TPA: hypothetical protein VFK03_00500 [Candidatus Saccharimonadales bacterium]|nr:hypothetical protein [Candidatus Saccharimonadales bacterium]
MFGWLLAGLFFLTFGVVFFGAPYVPTKRKDVDELFELVEFNGGRLIDLGSGDGRLLIAAAQRQVKSTGWELSPVIWLIAAWRLRPYRRYATQHLGSFWRTKLPDDTAVVFTFLVSRHMAKLDRYLTGEAKRLGHPIQLVSYGFQVDGRRPVKQRGALIVYRYQP